MKRKSVVVETVVVASLEQVWTSWVSPDHVIGWNFASDDWHTPQATNDLHVGGRFVYTMAAKDGSFSFDFSGTFIEITKCQKVITRLDDDRYVTVEFEQAENGVRVRETFEIEDENSEELQRQGWQAILDNFKKYVESVR